MKRAVMLAGMLLSASVPAFAQEGQQDPSALVQGIARCRSILEDAVRLRCFDETVEKLRTAVGDKEIAVVDRGKVRDTRRSSFGLPVPREGGINDDAPEPAQISRVDAAIAGVTRSSDGNWTVTLDKGGTWQQTDGYPLGRDPKIGDAVVITRAALGSYKMKVGRQASVRVRRLR